MPCSFSFVLRVIAPLCSVFTFPSVTLVRCESQPANCSHLWLEISHHKFASHISCPISAPFQLMLISDFPTNQTAVSELSVSMSLFQITDVDWQLDSWEKLTVKETVTQHFSWNDNQRIFLSALFQITDVDWQLDSWEKLTVKETVTQHFSWNDNQRIFLSLISKPLDSTAEFNCPCNRIASLWQLKRATSQAVELHKMPQWANSAGKSVRASVESEQTCFKTSIGSWIVAVEFPSQRSLLFCCLISHKILCWVFKFHHKGSIGFDQLLNGHGSSELVFSPNAGKTSFCFSSAHILP